MAELKLKVVKEYPTGHCDVLAVGDGVPRWTVPVNDEDMPAIRRGVNDPGTITDDMIRAKVNDILRSDQEWHLS